MFSNSYDVRMFLWAMKGMSEADGILQSPEDAYLRDLVSKYSARLRRNIEAEFEGLKVDGFHSGNTPDALRTWMKDLRPFPGKARYFIKEIIDMVWADGAFAHGEYVLLNEWAELCGVSNEELWVMLHCVRLRIEADNVLKYVQYNGYKSERRAMTDYGNQPTDASPRRTSSERFRESSARINAQLQKFSLTYKWQFLKSQYHSKLVVGVLLSISAYLMLFGGAIAYCRRSHADCQAVIALAGAGITNIVSCKISSSLVDPRAHVLLQDETEINISWARDRKDEGLKSLCRELKSRMDAGDRSKHLIWTAVCGVTNCISSVASKTNGGGK